MRGRLFTVASVLSLFLVAATGAWWLRSFAMADALTVSLSGDVRSVRTSRGTVMFEWDAVAGAPDQFRWRTKDPIDLNAVRMWGPDWSVGDLAFASAGWRSGRLSVPAWVFVALSAVLPLIRFRARLGYSPDLLNFLRGGQEAGRCRRCGYDLRATPDRCPECGAVPEPIPAPVESPKH